MIARQRRWDGWTSLSLPFDQHSGDMLGDGCDGSPHLRVTPAVAAAQATLPVWSPAPCSHLARGLPSVEQEGEMASQRAGAAGRVLEAAYAAVLLMAFALAWSLQPKEANAELFDTTCPYHHHIDVTANSAFTQRAGVAVGLPTGTTGMLMENANVTCARVVSIQIISNGSNSVELGAVKEATAFLSCPHPPTDNNWYRFWFKLEAGTPSCSSNYVVLSGGSRRQVAVYRDAVDDHKFHLEWNFTLIGYSENTGMTSGYPVANWERANNADSGFGEWIGLQYMDATGNFHNWGSTCWYADDDSTYSLDKISDTHIKVDATGSGNQC
jgi:hypothetical protein